MQDRADELRAAVAAHFERVRGALNEGDFARLVDDMARTAERLAEVAHREMHTKTPLPGSIPVHKKTFPPTRSTHAGWRSRLT
jgi:hypothetical protein